MTNQRESMDGPPYRVLIIDDELDGAAAIAALLKQRGCVVDVAHESGLALDRMQTFQPDAVLLDIVMPDVSGYEVARQIRAIPRFQRVPLFAVSGYVDHDHAAQSIEAGCDLHLVKPLDIDDLAATISRFVDERRATDPSAP